MVMNNQLTIGGLVAFQVLAQGVSAPIIALIGVWDTFQETLNAVERLNDVFESEPEIHLQADLTLGPSPTRRGEKADEEERKEKSLPLPLSGRGPGG